LEQRVDNDQTGARPDHPRIVSEVAYPIEMVENLARAPDTTGHAEGRLPGAASASVGRNDADPREKAGIIKTGARCAAARCTLTGSVAGSTAADALTIMQVMAQYTCT